MKCVIRWLMKNNRRKRELEIETMEGMGSMECLQYDFDTIKGFTHNFSENNRLGQGGFEPVSFSDNLTENKKLGEGGFSTVYKGTLPNGHIFAVKKIFYSRYAFPERQFKNEVLFMAKLQHQNLVRLLGFCLQGEEKLLIYEFVDKDLEHFIYDKIAGADFDWDKRYKVIGGIARGVQYLHENSQLRVVHRDLQPRNILLDEDMNAKITDFGVATGLGESNLLTNQQVTGTPGYIAPEGFFEGRISPKTDVYSFGVLVLVIVSGKRVISYGDEESSESLLDYVWEMWYEDMVSNVIDKNLLRSSSTQEIMRCIHIGLLCVQKNASDRPTMSSVVNMLSSTSITPPTPSRPSRNAFFRCNEPDMENSLLSASHNSSSVNSVSSTELCGQ